MTGKLGDRRESRNRRRHGRAATTPAAVSDDTPLYPEECFVEELLELLGRWDAQIVDSGEWMRIDSPYWDDYDCMIASLVNDAAAWVRVERSHRPPPP